MELIRNEQRNRFEAIGEYHERFIPKTAKFRWDPQTKIWWTDDVTKAARLADYASDTLATELTGTASEIEKAKDEAIQSSKAVDANIDVPVPEGLEYMPFQKAGIAYGMQRDGVLIADEMGLGKTIQALGIVNASPDAAKVLVICPASLRLNWKKEAEKWLTNDKWNIEIVASKSRPLPNSNFIIINYDILKKFKPYLDTENWDIMIADEVHYMKNPKSQRTQVVLGGYKSDYEPIPAKKKIYLTGTPIVNRPVEIQPVLASIAPKEFGNFFKFAMRFCDGNQTPYGWDFSGASNLGELQETLRSTCMVRRLKQDVLKELPAKRRAVVEIPANGNSKHVDAEVAAAQAGQYRLDELKAALELSKASDNPEDYDNAVAKLTEAAKAHFEEISLLRKQTAIAKAPVVAAHVKDSVEQGGKVVVFAHHHEVIDLLVSELDECGVVKLDGRDSMETRDQAVRSFQENDGIQVFVGGIKAAGVGLTLTKSAHVVFAELDWVPGNMSQAEDRCHRIGQDNQVLVQHIVLENSIDAQLAKTLVEKQKVIDTALDNEVDKSEAQEPVIPQIDEVPPVSARRAALAAEAEKLSDEDIAIIHSRLKTLSSFCDGANAMDGMGFNKMDTRLGKELAALLRLTPKQAALGQKLTRKYKRQLPEMAE